MRNLKYVKKIIGLSITSIAIATPIVIANSNISINNDSDYKLANYSQNVDTSNLVQLQNNQEKLLREISNRYDESQLLFQSWHKDIEVQIKSNIKELNSFAGAIFSAYKKSTTHYPPYPHVGIPHDHTFSPRVYYDNWDANRSKIQVIKADENNKSEFSNTFSNVPIKIVTGGSVDCNRYSSSQNVWVKSKTYTESFFFQPTQVFESPYQYEQNLKINNVRSFDDININFVNFELPYYDSLSENTFELRQNIKTNVSKNSSGELEETIKIQYDNKDINKWDLINFKDQDINWNKFFILKSSNIDNNGNYYYGTNRPSVEFALNLPLVNAINWYSRIPSKFIDLKNLMNNVLETFNNNQYLFNEIFGSKDNFFDFMNTYLFNFANFYYDEITFNNLVQFLKDLNSKEPSQEIRNAIKELITTKKDVQYKRIIIPANIKNVSLEDIKSGSSYNINLLVDSLNLNPLNFSIDQNVSNKFWLPDEFKNINPINKWNTYNDVILPIILFQNIFVEYEDHFGNQYQTIVYDASTQSFVKNAIKVGAVSGDFNSPYSSIKIKNISIGSFETKPYLGTNIEINKQSEFSSFVRQSKLNTTKTINGNIYASQDGFNDPIYMESTNDGIEIKFRYIASEKPVEEGAWSDIQGDNEISPFMLIPDEAWGEGESFDTDPNSSLEDILSDIKSKELFERAVARPFIMKKDITTQDLRDAKKKYVNVPNQNLLVFTKQDIENYFLNYTFTSKYNELSSKPWWTWTFTELVQEETNFNNGVSGSFNVVQDNPLQDQWFKNFISNPNLKNKTLQNFFPKLNEGRFFVFSPYKPSIDSTQVKLTEEAGFYYAGEQKDAYHQITNFNYVVELEVKNKTYFTDLDTFKFENLRNYNGKTISYYEYERMMNNLDDSLFKNKFRIQSSRFKEGQIQLPEFKYVPFISDNPLIKNGYGNLVIDYQKSIPVVNQIGNDVVYEQLPFDMMKLIGLESFYNNYKDEIVSLEEYNQLSEIQKESKILIDTTNNQIIIGGRIFSKYQDFEIGFVDLTPAFNNQKPENTIYGFNQKDKSYISLEEFTNQWISLSQEELIDMFIKPEFKKFYDELVEPAQLKMYVKVENNQLIVGYTFVNSAGKFGDVILAKYDLTCINSVITDIKPNDDFKYGYLSNLDRNMSLSEFKRNILKIDFLVNYFNFENETDKQNFINGIKEIKMLESNEKNFLIQIFLNDNYVTYNEHDSLQFRIYPNEIFKVSVGQGNLSIDNFANNVKQALKNKVNSQEAILTYLNSLSLNEKLSLFGTNEASFFAWVNGEDENGVINPDGPESERPEIEDIIFSFEGNNLKAEVQLGRSNLALDAKTNLVINDFQNQLKIDLGIIDPFKQKVLPWMIGGIVTAGILLIAAIAFIMYRRRRQKEQLLKSPTNTVVLTEKDLFSEDSSEDNNLDNNNNIENSL